MNVLAIDPGPLLSAWVIYDTDIKSLISHGREDNHEGEEMSELPKLVQHIRAALTRSGGLRRANDLLDSLVSAYEPELARLRAMEKRVREAKLEHFWLAYHTATMRLNEERVGTEFPAEEEIEVDHWWPAVKARLLGGEQQGKDSHNDTSTA